MSLRLLIVLAASSVTALRPQACTATASPLKATRTLLGVTSQVEATMIEAEAHHSRAAEARQTPSDAHVKTARRAPWKRHPASWALGALTAATTVATVFPLVGLGGAATVLVLAHSVDADATVNAVPRAPRWARRRAVKKNLDIESSRVGWGFSAGGHFAALLAARSDDELVAPPSAPQAPRTTTSEPDDDLDGLALDFPMREIGLAGALGCLSML